MIALMVIFCAGLLFPVVSPEFSGKTIISHLLSNHYSLVCHQSDQALVQINHQHTLVCARCLGIYFGALILFVIMTIKLFRKDLGLKPLIIFSVPMLLDAVAVRLSFYPYSRTVAFITGLLFGAVVMFYILDSIENSLSRNQKVKYGF
jgi:uncharacterized membrane protein